MSYPTLQQPELIEIRLNNIELVPANSEAVLDESGNPVFEASGNPVLEI